MKGRVWLKWIPVLVMSLCVGCAQLAGTTKPVSEMTPKEKLTYVEGIYNSQYAEYQRTAGYVLVDDKWVLTYEPELSDAKREVMRKKKKMLTDLYPMIQTFRSYVMAGGLPPAQQEQVLFELLDQLTAMAVD